MSHNHSYEKDQELGLTVKTIKYSDENINLRGGDIGTVVESTTREVRVEFENGEILYLPRYVLRKYSIIQSS